MSVHQKRIAITAIIASVMLSAIFIAMREPDEGRAQPRTAARVAGENGTFGPLGEWIPFPATPVRNLVLSATPFGTPDLIVRMTPKPTRTAYAIRTLTPEVRATITVRPTRDPEHTPPTRPARTPRPQG